MGIREKLVVEMILAGRHSILAHIVPPNNCQRQGAITYPFTYLVASARVPYRYRIHFKHIVSVSGHSMQNRSKRNSSCILCAFQMYLDQKCRSDKQCGLYSFKFYVIFVLSVFGHLLLEYMLNVFCDKSYRYMRKFFKISSACRLRSYSKYIVE